MTNCKNCDCEQEKHKDGIGKCSSRVMGMRYDVKVIDINDNDLIPMGIMDCECKRFES